MLEKTDYIAPVGTRRSWINIFGHVSGRCQLVNVNQLYERAKSETLALTRFNKDYFIKHLNKADALKTEKINPSFEKKTLRTISLNKLTVGVVVGAFVIGKQPVQIKQWIKKCVFEH